jgi:hypothetical protein
MYGRSRRSSTPTSGTCRGRTCGAAGISGISGISASFGIGGLSGFIGSRVLALIAGTVGIWGLGVLGVPGATPAAGGVGGAVAGGEPPTVTSQLPVIEPAELPPEVQELSVRYRDIFTALAAGKRAEAVEQAAALEAQTFAATPGKALEWLSMADGALVGAYLQARPDCALPLALFYQRLMLAHSAHRRFGLIHRAVVVASGIFAQMARVADSEGERRLTAAAHAGFAADLLTVPAPGRAAEMLTRGLLLTPDDTDANIALAVLLLRDRRQPAAETRLDRVLAAHPDHREARLRRALLRDGFSANGRAARELEKLATGGEIDWIALVAAQERVRRFLVAGDYDKSIAFLARVLERFPGDSSLRVALAFASARSSRRAEANLAVQGALEVRVAPGEGARRRFAELPIRLLRPQASLAEAAGEARLANLGAAIAGNAPATPASGAPGAVAPGGFSR